MKEKMIVLMAAFLVFVSLSSSAFAQSGILPCKWWGTVQINGTDYNSTDVVAFNVNTEESVSVGDSAPVGKYVITVENNISYVYFEVNGMKADQGNQKRMDGEVINLNLTVTDNDSDGYGQIEDCNDTNPDVNPGAEEIEGNMIDDDCNPETYDSFIGGVDSVTLGGVDGFGIKVNGSEDLSVIYSGEQPVVFYDSDGNLVEFLHDFSMGPLDLSSISIEKDKLGVGSVVINGLTLQGDYKKTVYVKNYNTNPSVCIKDVPGVASVSQMTGACNGADEFVLECNGTSGDYSCNVTDGKLKISGLSHSGIRQTPICGDGLCEAGETCSSCSEDCGECSPPSSPPQQGGVSGISGGYSGPPCTPDWVCTPWEPAECPVNEIQTRTCIDNNNCGNDANKPAEEVVCRYLGGESPGPLIVCGDDACEGDETCETCEEDCGTCPAPPTGAICGNDICESNENCENCEPDCGECAEPELPAAGPSDPLAGLIPGGTAGLGGIVVLIIAIVAIGYFYSTRKGSGEEEYDEE